jgi:tetratricopeptide (TPR) repeat protein
LRVALGVMGAVPAAWAVPSPLAGPSLADLTAAVRQQPGSADSHYQLGQALRAAGQLQQAEAELAQARRLKPNDGAVVYELAMAQLDRRDFVAATATLAAGLGKKLKPAGLLEYGMGRVKTAQDSLSTASVWLTKATLANPTDWRFHQALGDVYAAQRVTEMAVAEYEQALAGAPAPAALHCTMGRLYYRDRQLNQAVGAWRAAIAADSTCLPAYSDLINLYLITSPPRYEEVVPLLRRATALAPDSSRYAIELGRAMVRTPSLKAAALPDLERAVSLAPEDGELQFLLGGLRRERGEFGLALAAYEQANRVRPGSADILRGLAEAQKANGDTAAAIATLQGLVSQDTSAAAGVGGALGVLLYEQGRYAEAIPHLREKLRVTPKPILYRLLALSHIRTGDFAAVLTQVKPGLDSTVAGRPDRDYAIEYSNIGAELFRAKQYDAALAMFQARVAGDPANWSALLNIGLIQTERKAYSEAIGALKQAAQLQPENAQIQFVQGVCYHHLENRNAARVAFVRAADLDPKHADAHKMAGLYLLLGAQELQRQEKHAESQAMAKRATSQLLQAVELVPAGVDGRVLLAQSYLLANQTDKGIAAFARVLEIDPGNKEATEGMKRLRAGN